MASLQGMRTRVMCKLVWDDGHEEEILVTDMSTSVSWNMSGQMEVTIHGIKLFEPDPDMTAFLESRACRGSFDVQLSSGCETRSIGYGNIDMQTLNSVYVPAREKPIRVCRHCLSDNSDDDSVCGNCEEPL